MPTTTEIVSTIDERLEVLREEIEVLRETQAALEGPPAPRKRPVAPVKLRRPVKRAGKGARSQQALEIIKAHPGLSTPELAKELGIPTIQGYGLVSRLGDANKIMGDHSGWRLYSGEAFSLRAAVEKHGPIEVPRSEDGLPTGEIKIRFA